MRPEWTNMLSIWQWLALGAVPPALVVLYFLKLRRQPLEVPSTYLWRKSVEDMHVNALWQKLRRSLLLLLQLIVVGLVMLAVLNPTFQGAKFTANRFVFLIDNSASMSATDADPQGKATRLDLAKRRVGELIDGMKSGDPAMIISFSDSAEVVQEYTQNPHELRRRLAEIKPTRRTTSLTRALQLASGLSNPGRAANQPLEDEASAKEAVTQQRAEAQPEALAANLVVISDFKFADLANVSEFPLGNLTPKLELVGTTTANNVAITAFTTRRNEEKLDVLEAFGRIHNFSSQDRTFNVELFRDGQTHGDVREETVKSNEQKTVLFNVPDMESGVLELRIDVQDDLALDNRAWTVANPPRRGKVLLVTPGDEALTRALHTAKARELSEVREVLSEYLGTPEYERQASSGAFDLVIYDQCEPKKMPAANTLFIGRLPPDGRWQWKAPVSGPPIIDTDRTHPLVQLIEVGDFFIAEARPLKPPTGSAALFETAEGPIFAIAPREGFEDAVLGFEIFTTDDKGQRVANTNWPLRASFPLFVHETLAYLGGAAVRQETESLRPGRPLQVKTAGAAEGATVVSPSGRKANLPPDRRQSLQYSDTDETGIYEVRQGKLPVRRFAVNLFSPAESDIRTEPDKPLKIGHQDFTAGTTWEVVRRSAWKPLVLLGLGVLLLEWYIYNRRVYL